MRLRLNLILSFFILFVSCTLFAETPEEGEVSAPAEAVEEVVSPEEEDIIPLSVEELFNLDRTLEGEAPEEVKYNFEDKPVHLEVNMGWKGGFTIVLFFLVFAALVKEWMPPDIIMIIGAGILVIMGIITPQDFLKGFSRDIIFILAMLFIIARALEVNGILNIFTQRVLPKTSNKFRQLFGMMFPLSLGSAFLNNTPIVLMLTPVIRKWAVDRKLSPSKYLIPLSYATIMGGACTLIGTSSNLVVDGLLRNVNEGHGLGFFELARIGVPCGLVGFVYMLTIGQKILPERVDPASAILESSREFTSEFLVAEDCVLVNKTLMEASKKYFRGEFVVEIERGDVVIDSPDPEESIRVGDRLVFVGDVSQIAEIHAIPGLRSMADPHFVCDVNSSHFSEVVISSTSSLIGRTLRRVNFRTNHGASVLAVYRQGRRVTGRVGDIVLQAGDTLMLLSGESWHQGTSYNNDFYYLKHVEKLPLLVRWRAVLVSAILVAMVVAVTLGISMVIASLSAAFALIITKSITISEARKSIRWSLLVLIASAFAFGSALQSTGVANYFAVSIISIVGKDPHFLIAGIFILTMLVTEFITNNAAALLIFPIAAQTAILGGFGDVDSLKAIAVTVAIASSSSFATPIGYQTNTIVYGPGGYRFADYLKVGLPLSGLVLITCVFLIPKIWPMAH